VNYILNKVPYKKLKKHHMNYEKVEDFLINTSKCGGVLQR
jgi:hypothetical protein